MLGVFISLLGFAVLFAGLMFVGENTPAFVITMVVTAALEVYGMDYFVKNG